MTVELTIHEENPVSISKAVPFVLEKLREFGAPADADIHVRITDGTLHASACWETLWGVVI